MRNMHFHFPISKFGIKTINLSLVFTDGQHLMEVSCQCTKEKATFTHITTYCGFKTFHSETDHLKKIHR